MNRSGQKGRKHKFYKATKEFVVIALYLWLIFGLFAIYRSFAVALAVFKILEEAAGALYRGRSFHEGIADLAEGSRQCVLKSEPHTAI